MGKKGKISKRNVKMPKDALPLKKVSAALPPQKNEPQIDKAVEEFVDKLMLSEWQTYLQRPCPGMQGYYVICRWYPTEKQWSILYLGRGHVANRLDGHFGGKANKPISRYLSSFPRDVRQLIWFKWYDDPREVFNLQEMLTVIAHKWNNSEMPPFNINKIEELTTSGGGDSSLKIKKPVAKGSPLGL